MADNETQPGSTIEHITMQGGPLDGQSMDWEGHGGDIFYCIAGKDASAAESAKTIHLYRRTQEGAALFAYQGVQQA